MFKWKRAAAWMLTVFLILSAMPAGAAAADTGAEQESSYAGGTGAFSDALSQEEAEALPPEAEALPQAGPAEEPAGSKPVSETDPVLQTETAAEPAAYGTAVPETDPALQTQASVEPASPAAATEAAAAEESPAGPLMDWVDQALDALGLEGVYASEAEQNVPAEDALDAAAGQEEPAEDPSASYEFAEYAPEYTSPAGEGDPWTPDESQDPGFDAMPDPAAEAADDLSAPEAGEAPEFEEGLEYAEIPEAGEAPENPDMPEAVEVPEVIEVPETAENPEIMEETSDDPAAGTDPAEAAMELPAAGSDPQTAASEESIADPQGAATEENMTAPQADVPEENMADPQAAAPEERIAAPQAAAFEGSIEDPAAAVTEEITALPQAAAAEEAAEVSRAAASEEAGQDSQAGNSGGPADSGSTDSGKDPAAMPADPAGQDDPSAQDVDRRAALKGMSLSVTDRIGVNVFVQADSTVENDDYLEFSCAGKTVQEYVADAGSGRIADADGQPIEVLVFELPLALTQMTDDVGIHMVVDGQAGTARTCTVRGYADRILRSSGYADNEKNLLLAMLNLGACAQIHEGYNTDRPANDGIFAGPSSPLAGGADPDLSQYAYQSDETGEKPGAYIREIGLDMSDGISLVCYYKVQGALGDWSVWGHHAQLIDSDKTLQTGYDDEKGMYYVRIGGILPYELDEAFEINVRTSFLIWNYDSTFRISPFNTCWRMIEGGSSEEDQNLGRALYDYWEAASAVRGAETEVR